MAARYVTALKGVHLVSGRWSQTPTVCQFLRLHAAQCRPLHVSPAASQCSSRREPQQSNNTEDRKEEEGPEYIPTKKGKNPMMGIGYAWMIGLPTGLIGFLLAKRQVDKNRLKQLKIRQRMKRSNEGEYEGSRYRHHAEDVKLDQ
ncbi:DUF4748 domain-containing protein [Etheostoma cragini]|uniref:DUF4748 domain-containing protein n=1 Tax=Etheostoma cragini TaxID=417921 RepID=UPI00155E079F|nr:DUF4748 domain-containing protein [Etheostoma cragini]